METKVTATTQKEDRDRIQTPQKQASPEANIAPNNGAPRGAGRRKKFDRDRKRRAAKEKKSQPRSTRGRPRLLDEVDKARLCAYLESGLSRRQAAAQLSCHHSTITREIKRDPRFADDVELAERKGAVQPLVHVIHASKRSWRAAAWLLRNHPTCRRMTREEHLEDEKANNGERPLLADILDGFGGSYYNA